MNNIEATPPPEQEDKNTTQFEHKFFWWTLWTLVGTAFVVIAYFTDFTPYLSHKIAQRLASPPFFLPQTALDNPILPSSIIFFLGIAMTMFLAFGMLNAGSLGRKLIILISLLILSLAPMLIATLWQCYLPMLSSAFSLIVAGIGILLTPHSNSNTNAADNNEAEQTQDLEDTPSSHECP